MNREQAKELLPIIEAFANGEEVQWQNTVNRDWAYDSDPTFATRWTWRVKPKPREFILELNTDGTVRNVCEQGEEPWFDGAVHIKVREVL